MPVGRQGVRAQGRQERLGCQGASGAQGRQGRLTLLGHKHEILHGRLRPVLMHDQLPEIAAAPKAKAKAKAKAKQAGPARPKAAARAKRG